MYKSKLITGYLKWDGKKYVIDSDIDDKEDKIIVNIDNDNSKILYFFNGKCKVLQK